MNRPERLRALARDINLFWTYTRDGDSVVASCMNDDTKLRLSEDELNSFINAYAERLLEILESPGAVEWGASDALADLVSKIRSLTTVPDSTMSVIPAEVMGIETDWNVSKFSAPKPSDPRFVCFSTPMRLPHRQVVELSKHSKAIATYMSESSKVLCLCRGILRFDTHVHLLYTFHPVGDVTRMAVVSDYTNGRWKTSTGALIVNFLDWIEQKSKAETRAKTDDSFEVLISLYKTESVEILCDYVEHLAELQPQCDAAIQAWLRSKDLDTEEGFKPVERHTAAVNLYLEVMKMLVDISQKPGLDDFYRQAAARIRLATIYEVDASLLRQLLVRSKPLVDKITEQYSGTPEQRLHRAAQAAAPIPENRPFADMFIALSRPVRLDQYPDVTSRLFGQIRNRPTGTVWCEAIFITRDFPLLVFQAEPPHRELLSLWTDHWEGGDTLLPWGLPWLIRLLDEHNQMVVAKQTGRVAYQTRAKKLRVHAKTPPQYYAVTLRAHHLPSGTSGRASPRNTETEWHHRWHVQAHERAYVRRGPLPLDLKERERLIQHGYQVFETWVDARCRKALEDRGKTMKRHDEWMAIKYVRVEESIKPDRPDLPLVPSTRRIKLGMPHSELTG